MAPLFAPVGVLHIAMLGPDPERLLAGVRELGAEMVAVVGPADERGLYDKVHEYLAQGHVASEFVPFDGPPLLGAIRAVQDLATKAAGRYSDVLVNLAGADRGMACAGLSAAFVAGVKAIDVADGRVVFLPVLKFSYREVVSEAKVSILQALERLGGACDRLKILAKEAGLQDSLVSYHIRGGREGRGLEELGLVVVTRGTRGALTISLTPMGRLLAQGMGP